MKAVDVGFRSGRLVVVGNAEPTRSGAKRFLCVCDCGNQSAVRSAHLYNQRTKSCGCLSVEIATQRVLVHGDASGGVRSKEWRAWRKMWDRCTRPSDRSFPDYGARGISVWGGWKEFAPFLVDMGRAPSSRHSIDRIDNGGPYAPWNCRWATPAQQNQNQRRTKLNAGLVRMIRAEVAQGRRASDIAGELGLPASTVRNAANGGSWKDLGHE